MGSHGPGSVDVVADRVAGIMVDGGVSGVTGSAVVLVVVRVAGASTLFVLELSGVGEVGEAGQLAEPLEWECECEWL